MASNLHGKTTLGSHKPDNQQTFNDNPNLATRVSLFAASISDRAPRRRIKRFGQGGLQHEVVPEIVEGFQSALWQILFPSYRRVIV